MKKLISILVCFFMLSFMSCAGRNPVFIDVSKDSDNNLTCDEIYSEISQGESTIMDKYHEGKKKTSETVGAAVVGYLVIIPFFFMDLKKAEYKEMGNLMERRNHLIEVGKSKNCEKCNGLETDDELMARGQIEHERRMKEEKKEKPKEPVTINGRAQN